MPAKRVLRAWGAKESLDVKGMFRTTITTAKGAMSRSWVYVMGGHRPELLLGDRDAAKLGIVVFNPEGRSPTREEKAEVKRVLGKVKTRATSPGEAGTGGGANYSQVSSPKPIPSTNSHCRREPEFAPGPRQIPSKLRAAGIEVNTGQEELPKNEKREKARAWNIVDAYRADVLAENTFPRLSTFSFSVGG